MGIKRKKELNGLAKYRELLNILSDFGCRYCVSVGSEERYICGQCRGYVVNWELLGDDISKLLRAERSE
jgi:hypothetical protein